MTWKKLFRNVFYPHLALMILLVPISAVLLAGSMVFVGTESVIAYISYLISFYTLTLWCLRVPKLVRKVRNFKDKNKYARLWLDNTRLRVSVSLYGSLFANALYGLFQLWLGFYHQSFWFYSLGAYYICLGAMRLFLLLHTRRYSAGEKPRDELVKYRACGRVFLIMNLALALIVFFMVYWGRSFEHHMITAIAMAAYTFTALTVAIVNVVKYGKYKSPVFSASKMISLAAALVSLLTLESTMLTTFGDGTVTDTARKWMLGSTGGAVSLAVVTMAVYMIASATKKIKSLKQEV